MTSLRRSLIAVLLASGMGICVCASGQPASEPTKETDPSDALLVVKGPRGCRECVQTESHLWFLGDDLLIWGRSAVGPPQPPRPAEAGSLPFANVPPRIRERSFIFDKVC